VGDGEGRNSHIIRIGVLVIIVRSWKKAVMVLLRVFSLKRPTVGTFTLPFRIFGQKNRTGSIWQSFLSYFFVKKYLIYLLVGMSGVCYGWVNGWVSEWVSEWVRDVCMSHQSDWIYYEQPIKFLVVKVNGMWEDLIWIQFRILVWRGVWLLHTSSLDCFRVHYF